MKMLRCSLVILCLVLVVTNIAEGKHWIYSSLFLFAAICYATLMGPAKLKK